MAIRKPAPDTQAAIAEPHIATLRFMGRLRCQFDEAIERRRIEFGTPRDEGRESIPIWQIEAKQRRPGVVEDVLGRATVVTPEHGPVIGAVITAEAIGGEREQYRIVAPGEGESTLNRVPIDSPFGQLLARVELGSSFAVKVPHGARPKARRPRK